jgi:hypothetical protein
MVLPPAELVMNKTPTSPTPRLLPDRLGPEVLDLRLNHELEASASYTDVEPTAHPIDVERTAILCSSASHNVDRRRLSYDWNEGNHTSSHHALMKSS